LEQAGQTMIDDWYSKPTNYEK